jgi:hypothetical protein
LTLTATPVPTPTILPANTATPVSPTPFPQKCLKIQSSLPQNKSYDGKIVLIGKDIVPPGGNIFIDSYVAVSFYDLKIRQNIPIQQYKPASIIISPDRTKYALFDVSDYLVKVFSSTGKLLKIIPKGPDQWFDDRWLDDQHIALVVAKGLQPLNQHDIKYPRDVVIANPFTNEQKLIASDYPDIDRISPILRAWGGGSTTEYNATLTRVVYSSATIVNDYRGQDGYGYILWDIVHKQKLVQIVSDYNNFPPEWSPDYSKFIIIGQDREMYIVTKDGEVMQMTHLSISEKPEQSNIWYFPEKYSWSPDGRFVAFWLMSIDNNNSPSSSGTFVILDTVTGEITDYCISAGAIENYSINNLFAPVWSLDGKYLAINANMRKNGDSENFDTLLVDLEDGSAAKIGENLAPRGWLVTSQK